MTSKSAPIIEKARELGADLAGIAGVESLKDSPSHQMLRRFGTVVDKAFQGLGFQLVREGNHIAMMRENPDGTRTPLTMPNHRRIKGSTLRTILTQVGISREEFLEAYQEARITRTPRSSSARRS